MPRGTAYPEWSDALEVALAAISRFGAQALVVSLGVDTFAGDPISGFALQTDDYLRMGERLGAVGLPTVLVFEGGYAVDAVGVNAVNVLEGFMQSTR
jgi:acetoin utilization deacetylase AcuC-like enzyme